MMLTFPKPTALNGAALTGELRAAGFSVPDDAVRDVGTKIEVHGVGEADRDAVKAVVDAHVPPPPPADPQAEFAAAVEAATTIAELKAALLGTSGRQGAAAARRPAT